MKCSSDPHALHRMTFPSFPMGFFLLKPLPLDLPKKIDSWSWSSAEAGAL
jgi:hypothetical protein